MLTAYSLPHVKTGGLPDCLVARMAPVSRSPERRRTPDRGLGGRFITTHHRKLSQTNAFENEKGDLPDGVRDWAVKEAKRCDDGDPDLELCDLPEIKDSIVPLQKSTIEEAFSRGRWLVGLLVLQSSSSFILDSYQDLIKDHLVVTFFLTMLVGAGGNAGNQSAIKVIRGLATGTMQATGDSMRKVLQQQAAVALMLGTGLSAAGWLRVYLTNGNALNSTAISMSLFLIVVTSVLLGAALPFGLAKAGVDPANAGTTIQVLMDCAGVLITCVCCHYVLDTFAASLTTVAVVAS
ncbi:hypothetical protein Ndes2526B_g05794 [Nannochloris sp. 'desiccata']|nr:hypothetical protein KSW81_007616 [Chlorella desiccata (nom. nud.)]